MKGRCHKRAFSVLWLFALLPFQAWAQVTINQQPQSANVPTGATLTLHVQATGTGPLSYQWRLNGVNIPGANRSGFTITNFQPANSGDYSVAVADALGAVNSDVARIRALTLANLPFTDKLTGSNEITGTTGTGRGSNAGATREPGEPYHANKRGTHSVWLSWQPPPPGGVATFETAGSSFDTLLAVYTGDSVSNLKLVAFNDDLNTCEDPTGGFHTSRVKFNARPGRVYHIAVDGLFDAAGDIVLSWDVDKHEKLLPVVAVAPKVKVGSPGEKLNISASVQSANQVTRQWYFNCQSIAGETQTNLSLDDLQPSKVGRYTVRVKHVPPPKEEVASDPAIVQINITDGHALDVAALDKFPETVDSVRNDLAGAPRLQRAALGSWPMGRLSPGPALGYRGTQIFSTIGSTKDPGEPNHCGEPGGASEWYAYRAPANGRLAVDTEGSDFDTVLAVYTGSGTDFQSLVPVACDNNSGSDGKTSKTAFHVTKDTVYFIAVDGVGGAAGTVALNYVLTLRTISSIASQTIDEDRPTAPILFSIGDVDSTTGIVTVTGHSSNQDLVPDTNIFFGGSGSSRTVTLLPATNQFGRALITITVTDQSGGSDSNSFLLTVNAVNDSPAISSIVDQTIEEDTPTPPIRFSIIDVDSSTESLTVTGLSSNRDLVPDMNFLFSGTGPNRTVTLLPATNQFGRALITITVTDPAGASASSSFLLTVNPVNDLPVLSHIADQTTVQSIPTGAVPFTVRDVETPSELLTLTGRSSNTNLVPNENIVFGGSGSDRSLVVTPTGSQTGTAIITVTVADTDGGVASDTFVLTVDSGQAPQFLSSSMLSDGRFRLLLIGSPLQNTVIQASTDLSNWRPVSTNNARTNQIEWIDSDTTNALRRFYRAVR